MFYNTTTIPTTITETTPNFLLALLAGFITAAPFWVGIAKMLGKQKEETEEEEEVEEEEQKYMEELKALADRELNDTELMELQNKIVRETVESSDDVIKNFDIILSYHKETETFWYYTDHLKEVSYDTLEAVARKFVIEYNCKRLYLQPVEAEAEQTQAEAEQAQAQAEPKCVDEACAVVGAKPPVKSVFAKFKKYNTGVKGGNFSSEPVEQTNHFRYKGKLYQYEETLKQKTAENNTTATLDYAAYKLMMQAKKEN